MAQYCLTSEFLGGSALFEYDDESGMLVQATFEFVMPAPAAAYLATHFPTNVKLAEALRVNIKGRMDKVAIIPRFADFWSKYTIKDGKKKAEDAWKKLNDAEKVLAVSMIPRYKQSIPAWKNMVMGATWISHKRFLDFVKDAEHQIKKAT